MPDRWSLEAAMRRQLLQLATVCAMLVALMVFALQSAAPVGAKGSYGGVGNRVCPIELTESPPDEAQTGLTHGAYVASGTTVSLTATASCSDASEMTITVNGNPFLEFGNSATWNQTLTNTTSAVVTDSFTVSATEDIVAGDGGGTRTLASSTYTVNVDPSAPGITLTSATNGSTLTPPEGDVVVSGYVSTGANENHTVYVNYGDGSATGQLDTSACSGITLKKCFFTFDHVYSNSDVYPVLLTYEEESTIVVGGPHYNSAWFYVQAGEVDPTATLDMTAGTNSTASYTINGSSDITSTGLTVKEGDSVALTVHDGSDPIDPFTLTATCDPAWKNDFFYEADAPGPPTQPTTSCTASAPSGNQMTLTGLITLGTPDFEFDNVNPVITVTNTAPSVGAIGNAPTTVVAGEQINPTATFTDPGITVPALETYSASWNWGDGTANTVGTVVMGSGQGTVTYPAKHTYTGDGTYYVTLTVTDSNGLSGTSTTSPPTTSPVRSLGVSRFGSRLLFTWRLARPAGIAGFELHAGTHPLNTRLVPVHTVSLYHYSVQSRARGPFSLTLVHTNGDTQSVAIPGNSRR
jgi:hypothetical protein